MIRRTVWFTLGAVTGVAVYRRVAAFARSIPAPVRSGAVSRARSMARFGSDVREGVAEYMERRSREMSSTLGSSRSDDGEDGR